MTFRAAGGTGMPAHGLWLVEKNAIASAAPAAARRGSRPQMTVQDEATAQGVILTPTAAAKVSNLLAQEGRDDLKLRIAVQPGGCSGLRYQLYFDERDIEGDVKATYDGVDVVTDKMSAPYLTGATIDFVDTIEKQGFTIDNPNATGSCACGDSFH
jgi:iron-sulfur cluster assembly accessory protein